MTVGSAPSLRRAPTPNSSSVTLTNPPAPRAACASPEPWLFKKGSLLVAYISQLTHTHLQPWPSYAARPQLSLP